ncbi:MAG TPA: SusC/RagA family TonB-linked outer membrane protein [Kofleriaceae bacterium]|nr:SusC/RagA family TonB-linked outer membrane protein [Kofleriaceae bacterium]
MVDVDGNPIANATVTVGEGGPSLTTAADGSFKLPGLATGNLVIAVTADGFTAKQVPVLGATTALQLQIVLVRPAPAAPPPTETRMIGGVVSDAAHAPIAGATVRVHGTQIQGITAADGSFTLPGVALGDVTLDVEAPNQPPASVVVPTDKAAVAVTVGTAAAPPPPQTRTVHGKVTEVSGEPLAAAQVQVAGIPEATVFTETDGTFVFENLPAGKITLDVTAPEHESHVLEVPASKDTVLIPLGLASGEQIVIEGRAPSITKGNITGGGSVISGKDLTRVSAPTLDDAMVGKLAGANLQANSGAPGGGAQLRLRGVSTINGQNTPLYVIDGVIISNVATSSGINAISGAAGGGNPSNQDNPVNRIADLNPADIENVEVLKGASAAALYGSKAANGVVIITTKHGKSGENHAEVTQRVGFSQISNGYDVRNWGSIADVKDAFCKDPTADVCNSNTFVKAYMAGGGRQFNHESEIMRVPFLRETLASVTGGTENGNYYGSVLLSDEPGVMQGTFYNKQTGRVSIGYKFGDHVKLALNANLLHSLTDRGLTNNDNNGVSVYNVISATPSFVDLRPVNGVYPTNPAISQGTNLLQDVAEFQNREDVTRLISGATTTIDAYTSPDNEHRILLRGNIGIDTFDQKNHILSPPDLIYEQSTGLPGEVVDGTTTNTNMNLGASAVWNYTPHSGGYRSALTAGLTFESVDTHSVYIISRNLIEPKVDTATAVRSVETLLQTKEAGGYLQEELSLIDDRLSLLGGVLSERSSLNGDDNKYNFYPKLGAAFSLIKPAKPGEAPMFEGFESLRLRAAYGETGNRPNYGNKFTPLQATNTIGGSATLVVLGTAGDATIEPERQREFEGGIDMATKDQRIVAEVTGYQRNISNMLLQRALATSTGFGTQFINGGGLRNRGVEAAIAVKPIKNFDWTTRGTLTLNRSMVTELPVPAFNTGPSFGAGFGTYRIEVGKSATQIVSTTDGTGKLSVVGDGEPDFRIGWSNVINYGDFSLSTLLDWQHGSKIINLTQNYFDANGEAPDQAAAAKRLMSLNSGDPRPYIEDASFVKVREVSIAYSLPKRLVAQLNPLKSLLVSVSGRNLLTFTGYSGLDPEVSNFGSQAISRNFDVTPYPPSRTFWLSFTAGI